MHRVWHRLLTPSLAALAAQALGKVRLASETLSRAADLRPEIGEWARRERQRLEALAEALPEAEGGGGGGGAAGGAPPSGGAA